MTEGQTPQSLRAWHTRLSEASRIAHNTHEGQLWLAELRRYRLGEVERGQASVLRQGNGNRETRVGYATQLGNPGRGSWWVIGEPPLYGEFWPWEDGVSSRYRTRRDAVEALVRASLRWHLEHPG